MNEQFEENVLVEEENKVDEKRFSWRKMLCWAALLFSLTSPLIAAGLATISISSATEDEKTEVSILAYIAIGISVFFVIYHFIVNTVL